MSRLDIFWILFLVSTLVIISDLSAKLVHYDNQVYHVRDSEDKESTVICPVPEMNGRFGRAYGYVSTKCYKIPRINDNNDSEIEQAMRRNILIIK